MPNISMVTSVATIKAGLLTPLSLRLLCLLPAMSDSPEPINIVRYVSLEDSTGENHLSSPLHMSARLDAVRQQLIKDKIIKDQERFLTKGGAIVSTNAETALTLEKVMQVP
jgi:hypothetical protein